MTEQLITAAKSHIILKSISTSIAGSALTFDILKCRADCLIPSNLRNLLGKLLQFADTRQC